MPNWLTSLLKPPQFEDDERARVAELTYSIAWVAIVAGLAFVLFWPFVSRDLRPLLIAGLIAASGVFVIYLLRRGRVDISGVVITSAVWLSLTLSNWRFGGVRDVSYAAYITVIVLAGLLFGGRGSLVVAIVSALSGVFFAYAETAGWLPPDVDTPYEMVFDYTLYFLVTTALLAVSSRGLRHALERSRQSEEALSASNAELQAIRASLEQRVLERTRDMERRSRYLQAAAEVAYFASEILDTDQLIREVVGIIQEQFDLYYVGLFIVDSNGEWAVLRAGTGEAGAAMLARDHRIKVGEGMIGWCVANAKSRLAQRAEQDAVRLATPELPETRAEAALPLRSRDEVVGALSVQSTEMDYFDPDTLTVLQTMADQVAVALDNALLFAERETALLAARRAYAEGSEQAWSELLRGSKDWGYRYVNQTVRPLESEPWRPEMRQAVTGERRVQMQSNGAEALAIPIRSGERIIGVFSFRRPGGEPWTQDEVAFLETLTGQVEQALENARLLAETQLRAARDQQVGAVTSRFSRAIDVDAMLQTVVRELGRLPGVAEVAVHVDFPASDAEAPDDGREDVEYGEGA